MIRFVEIPFDFFMSRQWLMCSIHFSFFNQNLLKYSVHISTMYLLPFIFSYSFWRWMSCLFVPKLIISCTRNLYVFFCWDINPLRRWFLIACISLCIDLSDFDKGKAFSVSSKCKYNSTFHNVLSIHFHLRILWS